MSPIRLSGKRSLQEGGAVQTSSKLEDGSCVQQREKAKEARAEGLVKR